MTPEENSSHFAPGSAAEHDQGVLYKGDFQHPHDGTAVAIRRHALALASQGVPVLLKPHSAQVLTARGTYEPLHFSGLPDVVREEVGHLTTASIGRLHPVIHHFVIHKHESVSQRLMRGAVGPLDDPENVLHARRAVYGSAVVYSVWERDRIDEATARELRQVRDVWVPCEQNAEMLVESGLSRDQVFVVPHPYPDGSPLLHLHRRKPYSEKRFYFIGRWEPRKNPVLLLQAFCEAFEPGGSETLVLKHHGSWKDYPSLEETLLDIEREGKWRRGQILEHVTFIEGFLREDQILKLHFDNNIYVGPSAGEAFCLPAFEAKVAGNTVIHTPYGGTADFCDTDDVSLPFTMGEVPLSYGWPRGSQWARVERSDLVSALRDVRVPRAFAPSPHFLRRHSLSEVGAAMATRLRQRFQGVRW